MSITGLEDVTVAYANGVLALDRVSLAAEQGEIVAVLGPSGSGKSTLLRALAGLVPVRSGEVYIAGRQVTQVPAHERRVAMVFESSTLLPFLDVSQNLGWGLQMRQVPEPERRERIRSQVRGLRLRNLLARMPRTLSSGEQGRVGIGRALVHAPSAFLFDEPLAHLDAAERWQVRHRIRDVVSQHQVATLYVTHDQEEAMGIADRIALLDGGSLVQIAAPVEIYARPASIFAACFIGSPTIGLLPGRPVIAPAADGSSPDSGGFRVAARTLPIWAPLPAPLAGLVDREVVLGIRPEDVHDARYGSDPDAVTMPGLVVDVQEVGSHTQVTLEVAAPAVRAPGTDAPASTGAGPDGEQARLTSRFARNAHVRAGQSVPISVDVSRACVFDPVTGRGLWYPER